MVRALGNKLSQTEIDALIAGMLSGEVDQATLDAALAEAAAPDEAAGPAESDAAAPADPAVTDGAAVLVDLGPISQAEVDAVLRAAGKGSLISTPAPDPGPSLGIAPPAPVAPPAPMAPPPPAVPAPQTEPLVAAGAAPATRAPALPAFPAGTAGGILMDLELVLTAELVRTRMRLNQLLGLQPGSVLELDRRANEPVDLIINGHQMMKAKVVTIGENYGVQVTETRLQQPA